MGHYVAQHGEDKWLDQHWERLRLPRYGIYVEVGASDGIRFSNTCWLARQKLWSGVLIEPDPRSNQYLAVNRPESVIEKVAVGKVPGVSAFSLQKPATHSGLIRSGGELIQVQVETLAAIIDRNGLSSVDLISIDTEGTELDVWESLDGRFLPRIAILEWHTMGLPCNRELIERRLTADGYKLEAMLGGNLIFTRINHV